MASASAPKKTVILGSTGSIGQSALRVARDLPDRMEVIGLAACRSASDLAKQAAEFQIEHTCLFDQSAAGNWPSETGAKTAIPDTGMEGLIRLATLEEADLVLIAISGVAGLKPALAAIAAGKDIALASKEILVAAGETVMTAARESGVSVLPVDSEHNAIFQCLEGKSSSEVSRIILTASGGPFRTLPAAKLAEVTVAEALNHPTWEMGRKISIDSATLFNKGLEMIEARWLFDIEMERVEVVVHPQSIVHSMVEFVDGSVLAQLSVTDMCFPIQYAVTWPERVSNRLPPLDFAELSQLDFEKPRWDDFPALQLAREAGSVGGTLPAVLNAANEVAVDGFLSGQLSFPAIWESVAEVMARHKSQSSPSLDQVLDADQWARDQVTEMIKSK